MTLAEKRKPWMKWYPRDWRAETGLQLVTRSARSLWIDMLGLMHESTLMGYLLINGKPPTPEQLARVLGDDIQDLSRWLDELAEAGVYSETDDGIIYSRRMVRDHEMAEKGREDVRRRGGAWGKSDEIHNRTPDSDPNRVSIKDPITQRPEARDQKKDTVGPGTPGPTKSSDYPEDFEEFWKAYPRSPNMSKSEAGKSWLRLKRDGALPDKARMLQALGGYRKFLADQSRGRKDPHPAAHAATWLNQRRFDGFLEAPAQTSAIGDTGPGWEAEFPDTWGRLRKFYSDQHRSDVLWQNTFARVRPDGSPFRIACTSRFERDHLTEKYGENLKRLFGQEVEFVFEPTASRAPVPPAVSQQGAQLFPTPEGQA